MRRLLASARVFFSCAYYSYVALFRWFRPATYLASKVVMPVTEILFFTILGTYAKGRDSASFFAIGNAIQLAAINGTYGVTMSVGGERWAGTMGYLFGAPTSRLLVFTGRAFMHVIDGMLGVVLGLLWGVLLLNVDLSRAHFGGLALAILVTAASTSGMGLLLGCLALITRNIMFINNTVYFLMLVICGANVPVSSLPSWVQKISYSLPLTRGMLAARQLVDGATVQSVSSLLRMELAVGLVYAAVGYAVFRQFETQAKKRGTLEVM
jgi:ABC-2 type transport system permease protein